MYIPSVSDLYDLTFRHEKNRAKKIVWQRLFSATMLAMAIAVAVAALEAWQPAPQKHEAIVFGTIRVQALSPTLVRVCWHPSLLVVSTRERECAMHFRHSELVSCGCHTIVLAFNPHSLLPELHHIVYCNAPQPRLMPLFVCVISSVFSCEA